MERLRRYAIAPMVVQQAVSYGYRSTTEDHYYFFLPDLESLHSFAAEYQDARTFFLALESTDFSELIHDVKIQVRIKATNTEQVPITFHQLSEGEQQLLMVLGLMRFTKSHQSLVLARRAGYPFESALECGLPKRPHARNERQCSRVT